MACDRCGIRLLLLKSIEAGRCDLCRFGWPVPGENTNNHGPARPVEAQGERNRTYTYGGGDR